MIKLFEKLGVRGEGILPFLIQEVFYKNTTNLLYYFVNLMGLFTHGLCINS